MTDDLQARTAEAERLYTEAIERNQQLAEMYERLQSAQRSWSSRRSWRPSASWRRASCTMSRTRWA